MAKAKAHLTVSLGESQRPDQAPMCDTCGSFVWLVIAPSEWVVDGSDDDDRLPEDVEIFDEVTGHYCPKCERMTSLSFNSRP